MMDFSEKVAECLIASAWIKLDSPLAAGSPPGENSLTTGSQRGVNRPSGPNTRGKVKIARDLPRITLPRFDSSVPLLSWNAKSNHGGSLHGNHGCRRIQISPRLRRLRN